MGICVNHAWPVCEFMHMGKACLRSFFFAAPVKQSYNRAVHSLASPKSSSRQLRRITP